MPDAVSAAARLRRQRGEDADEARAEHGAYGTASQAEQDNGGSVGLNQHHVARYSFKLRLLPVLHMVRVKYSPSPR